MAHTVFHQNPLGAAQALLGWEIHRGGRGGRIVETEAYAEHGDEACHTFFKHSARDFVNQHQPGALYVYLNYGVHWLLNFLVEGSLGERGFVLIRALEPLTGLEEMKQRRGQAGRSSLLREKDLCSGPGKLTQALGLGVECHGLSAGDKNCPLSLRCPTSDWSSRLVVGPRIGISKAMNKPWRFGVAGSPHLSRPFPSS